MEVEGGEEFVMEETSGVSKGVSDNSRTSACSREHLRFPVTVVCDVLEGSRRFLLLYVVLPAAPLHNIAKRELCCLVIMLAITLKIHLSTHLCAKCNDSGSRASYGTR